MNPHDRQASHRAAPTGLRGPLHSDTSSVRILPAVDHGGTSWLQPALALWLRDDASAAAVRMGDGHPLT